MGFRKRSMYVLLPENEEMPAESAQHRITEGGYALADGLVVRLSFPLTAGRLLTDDDRTDCGLLDVGGGHPTHLPDCPNR